MIPFSLLVTWMLVGAICNVSCALVGCYLVLRRLSLLGDAISHAVLPGLALAFLVTGQINGWPVVVGAILFGVLTTFLSEAVTRLTGVREDAGMGIVFTALFALGVILITRAASQVDLDPGCVLYGLLEFVPLDVVDLFGWKLPRALLTLVPVLVATVAFLTALSKELQLTAFDPALAQALGFRPTLIHYLLMALVSAVTVSSFEAVGSILVIAMLIVPGATAHLLTDRLRPMLAVASGVGILSAVLGTLGAQWLDTNLAGMMAVAAGVQLALAAILAPRHGILSKMIRNARLALRIRSEDVLTNLYRQGEGPLHARHERQRHVGQFLTRMSLWWCGEIERGPHGWHLSPSGRKHAESLVRAHRLWEAYLSKELRLPADHLHDPAEVMEHFLDASLQEKLLAELGSLSHDPHGRPIPGEP